MNISFETVFKFLRGKQLIGVCLVLSLVTLFLVSNSRPANAFAIGCKSAQKEANMLASRAEVGMKLEYKYRLMPIYADAYRQYKRANEDYRNWERVVAKSPKCFKKSEVENVKRVLKPVAVFESMSTRYGKTIAERFNYGSSDPCFKLLGDDSAYLACSIENY